MRELNAAFERHEAGLNETYHISSLSPDEACALRCLERVGCVHRRLK